MSVVSTEYKEVDRFKYCKICKHFKEDEFDINSTCYDCMFDAVNQNSHKPTGYEPLAENSDL